MNVAESNIFKIFEKRFWFTKHACCWVTWPQWQVNKARSLITESMTCDLIFELLEAVYEQ